jgi:hypothetical protein
MVIGDTLTLEGLASSSSVKFLDEPDLLIATLSPPRLQSEEDEGIEQETELVGEDAGKAADGDSGDGGEE